MSELRNDIREAGTFGIVDRDCADLHDDTVEEIIQLVKEAVKANINSEFKFGDGLVVGHKQCSLNSLLNRVDEV